MGRALQVRATLDRVAFRQPLMEQAKPTWALDPDRVLYLPFWNMPDGEVYLSQDAYGHTCTRYGATPTGQGYWSFDGTDDYVDCGSGASLDILTPITLWAWIKPITGFLGTGYVISDRTGDTIQYGMVIPGNGVHLEYIFHDGTAFRQYTKADALTLNVWQRVAIRSDGTNIIFYVQGVAVYTTTTAFTPAPSAGNTIIGSEVGTESFFKGFIREASIDNRACSAGDAWNDFQQSRHLFGV